MDLNSAPVSKNLIIINVLVWLAFEVMHRMGIVLDSMFALHMFAASDFRWYQLITYQFMHGSFMHVFFNMLAVFWFGPVMERTQSIMITVARIKMTAEISNCCLRRADCGALISDTGA